MNDSLCVYLHGPFFSDAYKISNQNQYAEYISAERLS
jgi:hypothetical protein